MITEKEILKRLKNKGLDVPDNIFQKKDLSLQEKKTLNLIRVIKGLVLSKGENINFLLDKVLIKDGKLHYLDFFRRYGKG